MINEQKRKNFWQRAQHLSPGLSRLDAEMSERMNARLSDIRQDFRAPFLHSGVDLPLDKCAPTRVASLNEITPASADLVISYFELHTVQNVPQYLQHVWEGLRPNGLFLALFPGQETLHELRHAIMHAELEVSQGAAMRVYPMITMQDAATLMQNSPFSLCMVDLDQLTGHVSTVHALLEQIHRQGESNALKDVPPLKKTRQVLSRLEKHYPRSAEGYSITIDMIYMMGWKP